MEEMRVDYQRMKHSNVEESRRNLRQRETDEIEKFRAEAEYYRTASEALAALTLTFKAKT